MADPVRPAEQLEPVGLLARERDTSTPGIAAYDSACVEPAYPRPTTPTRSGDEVTAGPVDERGVTMDLPKAQGRGADEELRGRKHHTKQISREKRVPTVDGQTGPLDMM